MGKSKKLQIKTPHTYALLIMIIIIAWMLTYLIPAGEYQREKKGGQTLVVSGTYHEVAAQHGSFLEVFRAIPQGLISGSEIVFYIFLVGGAFGIIHKTGAFENGVNKTMYALGKANYLMIPLTMTVFSILGFSIGLAEETIIFVPIGILIARTLGYDALTGAAMVILGAASGFIGGMLNPFTVGVAQKVAESPMFSGWGLRTIIYLFILIAAITTVMRYGHKVKKDKTKSLVYDLEQEEKDFTNKKAAQQFSKREALCLLFIILAILINVVGIFTLNWSFNEMSLTF